MRDRPVALQAGRDGSLGDAARTGGCDPLDQTGLLDMLRLRRADRASLHRIRTWLQASLVDTEGQVGPPETGTPQGGTVSPVLAQGSLHDALALWCEHVGKPPGQGAARRCR